MPKPTVKSRAISPAQQEWLLENSIFKQPSFKEAQAPSRDRSADDFVPLSYRIGRSLEENKKIERKAYDTLWAMCHGECSRKTFGSEQYGNWHHLMDKVYNGFFRKGTNGAIIALRSMFYYDDQLCQLFIRYALQEDLISVFGRIPRSGIHKDNPWTTEHRHEITSTPKLITEHCQCVICLDDKKYPPRLR